MSSSTLPAPAPRPINPLLAAYLRSLTAHPVRTKAATSAVLQFFQEVLASHLAGGPRRAPKGAGPLAHALARAHVDGKALKMAAYGALVSAPLSHTLVGAVQRAFAGRTGLAARLGQLAVSNFVVAPIQVLVYLVCTAVINGARSTDEVLRVVRGGFMRAMRVTWTTLPLTIVIAQAFIPPELWVPFMNGVQFMTGTYTNTNLKRIRQESEAKARKEHEEQEKKDKTE